MEVLLVEHRNIIDAERHEARGASSATAGQVLRADGLGNTQFVNADTLSTVSIASTLEAMSTTTQSPVAVDTPIQVSFGPNTNNTDVSVTAVGNINILTSGLYFITFNLNFGRTNNTGIAIMAARLSLNGVPIGITQAAKIDTSVNITSLNASLLRRLTVGDVLRVDILRDSAGANDGGLFIVDPVLAGWATSPSALARIQRVAGGY